MTQINGYPHALYLVGVVIVFACTGLGGAIARLAGLDGWPAAAVWIGSFVVGFGVARQANVRLFQSSED